MIQAALFGTAILALLLGVVVFMNDPKSRLFRIYLSFSILSALWMAVNAVVVAEPIKLPVEAQLLFAQLITPLALATSLTFYLFLRYFSRHKLGLMSLLAVIPTLLVSSFALTDFNVYLNDKQEITLGGLYPFYLYALLINVALVFYSLYGKRATGASTKAQLRYLRWGAIVTIIPAVGFGSILPLFSDSDLSNISPLSSIAFLTFAGIAMVKHRLFDVRLAAARATAYFLAFAVILLLSSGIINGVRHQFSSSYQWIQDVVSLALFMTAMLLYPILKKFFDRVTNQIFYRDAYDPQEFLDQLNAVLVGNIELEALVGGASEVIEKNLKSEFVAIGLNDKENSITTDGAIKFNAGDARTLRELLEAGQLKTVQADNLPNGNSKLHKLLRKYDIALVYSLLPNAQERQGVGYLILGNKKSGNLYGRADLRLLEVVSDELAITVQNALHFKEIKGFSATLQRKVDTATRELRRSNNKLKELDEAKDEFLSMASHQLRTPLTSVKGFISMVIDGDVGPISEQQRKVLEQAFESSQRMVFLIGDFLNVSRIKSGKFVIDKIPFDIIKLVHEEVNQLKDSAKARGLEFVYDPPAHMPEVLADRDKLRQVMMNFMDNALYYSPNGGKVTIRLYKDASGIVFKVSDTGIGVPKAEQEKLFTKFFRAENARQQRPDGTGIGLYMAKKVIVGHEGSLIFESVEGKGSTFGFRLPLKNNLK